jgi:hypothetical protein
MKNMKWCLLFMLLFFLAVFVFYFTYNNINNIVIKCNLEISNDLYRNNIPYETFSAKISTEISHIEKYKSIRVDYPNVDNLGLITKHITSSLLSETEKDTNNIYIKSLEIDIDPQGMSYQKIRELLMNQFIEVTLESISGKESIKKYSIGELLKDKTNL